MEHKMKLLSNPFNKIVDGSKEIEFRLYDDKRKEVKIGDTIEFSKLPNLIKKLNVEVVALYQYSTFKELLFFLGYKDNELEEKVEGMYSIYNHEQEKKHGVLGIKIKKLEEEKEDVV